MDPISNGCLREPPTGLLNHGSTGAVSCVCVCIGVGWLLCPMFVDHVKAGVSMCVCSLC
mgnify:CR=1 FL=1